MSARDGEKAALYDLAALYQAEYAQLVRLAYLLLGDPGDAEDAVQEAFARVHEARHRIRDHDRLLAYLRSTVLNFARSGLRRRLVALRRAPAPSPDERSAEDRAIVREDHRRVVEALRKLPQRQRECLVLRYYLDLSEAEIAATLNVSAGSVKTHVHRGLAALERKLGEA